MDEDFLSEDFLRKHISACKEDLRDDGFIAPFLLVQLADKTPVCMPVVGEFRPHNLIYAISKTLQPRVIIFTSQGVARSLPLSKNYKYGDIRKSKRKQRVLLINIIDFKGKTAKLVIVPFRKVKGDLKFEQEQTTDMTGKDPVSDVIEELFRETDYIR